MKDFSKDPNADKEATRYENPIASREWIMKVLEERGKPASHDQLCGLLKVDDTVQQEALRRRLEAMARDGQLLKNRRGSFGLIDKLHLIRGRVHAHRDGYGFVIPEDKVKHPDDLVLNARSMRSVFHNDRVLVHVSGHDRRGREEAVIIEVLERNTQHVVGRLFEENGIYLVVPDSKTIHKDVFIPPDKLNKAEPGQIVMANIIAQPSKRFRPTGEISEVLGEHMAPGMEIDIALRSRDLPHKWTPEVLAEIEGISETVSEADKKGRFDVRDLPLVTIDGETARDFDDAVYAEALPKGGWRLIVAIADVSHYVQQGSALDSSAEDRGNSVYFPGEVIPMLPEILSNGLCSLNPHTDRLCMICDMQIDTEGKLKASRFVEGVMHSQARLTYTQVGDFLQGNQKAIPDAVQPAINTLNNLYETLRSARAERGAIDFETTETQIVFDEHRKIQAIVPVHRNDAHKIIEECMLMANVAAAKFVQKEKLPSLYRVHGSPKPSKIDELREFLKMLGLQIGGGETPAPKDFSKLLRATRERPDAEIIQTVMLRSLSQAVYSPDDDGGHFGLGFDAYAHFTSPIRRYPDLLLHRAIRHHCQQKSADTFAYTHEDMQRLGDHCSMTERRADDATRDVMDWLKCEFMQDKVGENFSGNITGVTSFGLFVQLDEVYVEGLVHVTALNNDYYRFDPQLQQLLGERTGKRYRLRDKVDVVVARVDIDERQIDFQLQASSQKKEK
ncbi:MAG: ribonuclease R [marine bacterium B5-7]|nr:MAG: ribonuclease R [marine bacterium B5-7]